MKYICGVDEAGRGPLAGPVTAAAVILPADFPQNILCDSKKIEPKKREQVAHIIKKKALSWSIGWAWPEEIDILNIHNATLLSMKRAINCLKLKPHQVKIDGLYVPDIELPCIPIKKGDTYIPEIMAASIIAKTERDELMKTYAKLYPIYEFDKHKGYPTKLHREIIQIYGLSPIHRKSFKITYP